MEDRNFKVLKFMTKKTDEPKYWIEKENCASDNFGQISRKKLIKKIIYDLRVNFDYYEMYGIGQRPLTRLEGDLFNYFAKEVNATRRTPLSKIDFLRVYKSRMGNNPRGIDNDVLKVVEQVFKVLRLSLNVVSVQEEYCVNAVYSHTNESMRPETTFKKLFVRVMDNEKTENVNEGRMRIISELTENEAVVLASMYEVGLVPYCSVGLKKIDDKEEENVLPIEEVENVQMDQYVPISIFVNYVSINEIFVLSRVSKTYRYAVQGFRNYDYDRVRDSSLLLEKGKFYFESICPNRKEPIRNGFCESCCWELRKKYMRLGHKFARMDDYGDCFKLKFCTFYDQYMRKFNHFQNRYRESRPNFELLCYLEMIQFYRDISAEPAYEKFFKSDCESGMESIIRSKLICAMYVDFIFTLSSSSEIQVYRSFTKKLKDLGLYDKELFEDEESRFNVHFRDFIKKSRVKKLKDIRYKEPRDEEVRYASRRRADEELRQGLMGQMT